MNNKKSNKKSNQPTNNRISVPLYLRNNITAKLQNDIYEVLDQMPFGKISISLATYKRLITNEDTTQLSTAGYITGYDKEKKVFTAVIFNEVIEKVKAFTNPMVTLLLSETPDGSLRTITKFIVEPGPSFPVAEEKPAKKSKSQAKREAVQSSEPVEKEEVSDSAEKVILLDDTVQVTDAVVVEETQEADKNYIDKATDDLKKNTEKKQKAPFNKIQIPDEVKNAIK